MCMGKVSREPWKDLQPVAARILSRSVLRGPHQGYLFSGSHSSGVEEAAVWFSRGLNCEHPLADGEACGTCRSCTSLATGTGPDILILDPENGVHRIETMRRARSFCSLKRAVGRYRVLIINQAEALTPQAAGSLLKLLEEPPDFCVIILCSFDPDSIPDTIRSRLVHIRFKELPIHAVKERLGCSVRIEDQTMLEILASSLVGTPGLWHRLTKGSAYDQEESAERKNGDGDIKKAGSRNRSGSGDRRKDSIPGKCVEERLAHCLELGRRLLEFRGKSLSAGVLDIADEMADLEEDFLEFSLDAMMTMLWTKMLAVGTPGRGLRGEPSPPGSSEGIATEEVRAWSINDVRRLRKAIKVLSEARANLARKVNPKLLMEVTAIKVLRTIGQ